MTVRRWEGIIMDYLNIQDRPILGYGTINNSYVNTHISSYLLSSNGIVSTFARFGIVLGLLINIVFIRNTNYIDKLFRQKYCMFYILYMTLSISYSFTTLALMIALCSSNLWISKYSKIISNRTILHFSSIVTVCYNSEKTNCPNVRICPCARV